MCGYISISITVIVKEDMIMNLKRSRGTRGVGEEETEVMKIEYFYV